MLQAPSFDGAFSMEGFSIFPQFLISPFHVILSAMSKESSVFVFGGIVFFTSFLGVPSEYKEWIFIIMGALLMIIGYRLRRIAFLRSLEHESGERRGEAFVENSIPRETSQSKQIQEENVL